jgi:hypothetical protein
MTQRFPNSPGQEILCFYGTQMSIEMFIELRYFTQG